MFRSDTLLCFSNQDIQQIQPLLQLAQLCFHYNITTRYMFQPSLTMFQQVHLSRLESTWSNLCPLHKWLYLLYIFLYICFYATQQRYVSPYTTGFYGWVRHVVDRDVSLYLMQFFVGCVLRWAHTCNITAHQTL